MFAMPKITLPANGTVLFDATLKPGDPVPLTMALFRIFAESGFFVGEMVLRPEGPFSCGAVVELTRYGEDQVRIAKYDYGALLNVLSQYLTVRDVSTCPAIIYHAGKFCVLPSEPFLSRQNSGLA